MTERAQQLHTTAVAQIEQLIGLLSSLDATALRLPCPGREKLGDGTVGALARHTADNYQRIAAFVQGGDRMSATHRPSADHIDPSAVIAQLSAARDALARLADFTESQLDAIPPKDSFRFCDGQRTTEQVLVSLIRHQDHQLAALRAGADGLGSQAGISEPRCG